MARKLKKAVCRQARARFQRVRRQLYPVLKKAMKARCPASTLGDARVSLSTHQVRIGHLLQQYRAAIRDGRCQSAQTYASKLAREAKNICWHQGRR